MYCVIQTFSISAVACDKIIYLTTQYFSHTKVLIVKVYHN